MVIGSRRSISHAVPLSWFSFLSFSLFPFHRSRSRATQFREVCRSKNSNGRPIEPVKLRTIALVNHYIKILYHPVHARRLSTSIAREGAAPRHFTIVSSRIFTPSLQSTSSSFLPGPLTHFPIPSSIFTV